MSASLTTYDATKQRDEVLGTRVFDDRNSLLVVIEPLGVSSDAVGEHFGEILELLGSHVEMASGCLPFSLHRCQHLRPQIVQSRRHLCPNVFELGPHLRSDVLKLGP